MRVGTGVLDGPDCPEASPYNMHKTGGLFFVHLGELLLQLD